MRDFQRLSYFHQNTRVQNIPIPIDRYFHCPKYRYASLNFQQGTTPDYPLSGWNLKQDGRNAPHLNYQAYYQRLGSHPSSEQLFYFEHVLPILLRQLTKSINKVYFLS